MSLPVEIRVGRFPTFLRSIIHCDPGALGVRFEPRVLSAARSAALAPRRAIWKA